MNATSDHFDQLEIRDPEERERDIFARLPGLLARAIRAPGWAAQLAGVDPQAVRSRAALAGLPLLRKSALTAMQKERPPFGDFNVTAPGRMRRLLMSPGPIFEPEGDGDDAWGAARALYAAGFRSGDIVHNCVFLSPHPGRLHRGVGRACVGCAVIPAGTGNTEQQLEAIAQLKPSGYIGTPDFLKVLLDAAAKARQGRFLARARARFGRGAAGLAAPGAGRARRRRAASATPPPTSASSPMRRPRSRWDDRQRGRCSSRSCGPAPAIRSPRARWARSSSPRSTPTIP